MTMKNIEKAINFTIITGFLGAGKSTLIKAMMDLIPLSSGYVKLFDTNLDEVRQQVSYVPQRGSVDWDFPSKAVDSLSSSKRDRRPSSPVTLLLTR